MTTKMKDNAQRGKFIIVAFWISLGLEVLSLLSSYFQYDLLLEMQSGIIHSQEELTANDLRVGIIVLIYLVARITTIVLFIMWFRRAYFNLHQKVMGLEYDEGWAAGSWFVPILNLIRPYKIMSELYVETNKFLRKRLESKYVKQSSVFVGIWWTLWIVYCIINNISLRSGFDQTTIEGLIQVTQMELLSSIVGIPLILIVIKVITDYTEMERIFFQFRNEDQEETTSVLDFESDEDILDATI